MRHLNKGRKLKRTHSHKKALMRSLATALFEHKKIKTTEAKAKELRPYAEKLITKAKKALAREEQGLLADGQKVDFHTRRIVSKYLASKAVLQELFDAIAPAVEERNGGYCRIVKTGIRRGDSAREAIIELVDWAAPVDGASSLKPKKKRRKKQDTQTQDTQVTEETPEEEAKTEEAPEGEAKTEEAPEEETKTEETPEEEAKIEGAPEEETKTEEAPEEEAKTEEASEEEAKTEEAPEEEAKTEDKENKEDEDKK